MAYGHFAFAGASILLFARETARRALLYSYMPQ